jgi:SAM dependent carboxyl methyltransferase
MAHEAISTHGVMERGGSYNLHARVPADGALLALPLLEKAVQEVALDRSDEPIVIGDYGSSQGKNSLSPMRAAIRGLRARVGLARPIVVSHVDQPANDFNVLFDVLDRDRQRYSLDDPNVFPSAIGRSFYETVFPQGQVHLGWSSFAAVWLSHIPRTVPGHIIAVASTGEVREVFERQGTDDWKLFLSLRASELRPGGRLVVVLPGLADDGGLGFEPLFDQANQAIAELVTDGLICAEEHARMVLGAYPRTRAQLLAPFASQPSFQGLAVEHCELSMLPDAAWKQYERDGNTELLVTRQARFFRSVFVPSLATAIADQDRRSAFPQRLEQKLKRLLAERPAPFHSFVQTMLLAKSNSSVINSGPRS